MSLEQLLRWWYWWCYWSFSPARPGNWKVGFRDAKAKGELALPKVIVRRILSNHRRLTVLRVGKSAVWVLPNAALLVAAVVKELTAKTGNIVTAHDTGSKRGGLGHSSEINGDYFSHPAGAGVFVLYLAAAGEIDAMRASLWRCRQGMEMWQLVLMVLALILLFFLLGWFLLQQGSLERLLGKVGELF